MITATTEEIITAPAAISFAIFATELYSDEHISIIASIEVLIISNVKTLLIVKNNTAYFTKLR